MAAQTKTDKVRRVWDKQAPRYDRGMAFWERRLFRGDRQWVCGQAEGDVLEIAVGTGRNFSHYPGGVRLTGFDLSPEMVARARETAEGLGMAADLSVGDAQRLEYADASFDTVVCTFSFCAIPNPYKAAAEIARVLRPGGKAVLAEHVRSPNLLVRTGERIATAAISPFMHDHFLRTPDRYLADEGLQIGDSHRHHAGFVHRFVARKPA